MNPMTNMKNVKKLSEQELSFGMKTSWHDQYKQSAWIFVGGLPFDLTEGDIICVFSQYGEVVNINLVRDKGTGKSRGFCFICYEDQRSTNLSVDNLNGIKLLNRTIRVDHCEGYKAPKDDKMDEESQSLHAEGCAPGSKFGEMPKLPSSSNGGLDKGFNLPPMESLLPLKKEKEDSPEKQKAKKDKTEKKAKKTKEKIKKLFRKKKKEESSSSSSSSDSSSETDEEKPKKKRTKKSKSKQRKDESSSSSSDDSDSDNGKSKSKKKHRKDSSSDSDSDEKSKKKINKGSAKNKSSESEASEDEDKRRRVESSQRLNKSSRHDASNSSGNDKYGRDSERQRNEFSERSDRHRKLPTENDRENYRRHGNESKGKDVGRYDRDRSRHVDRDRHDDRERREDGNRRDDRDRKYSSDKYHDSRRHDYERKDRR